MKKLKQFNNSKLGYTLIELIVVVTIIGLLSTIGITGFQSVTRSGRDALRKTDLEQLRSALEIYKSENNIYPLDSFSDLVPDYINPYPIDSKSPTYEYYYIRTDNLTYQLCAHLENGDSITDGCEGLNNCGANCNYQVANP